MNRNVWRRLLQWPLMMNRDTNEAPQTESVSITLSDTSTVIESNSLSTVIETDTISHNQIQRLAVSKPDIKKRKRVLIQKRSKRARESTPSLTSWATDSDVEWEEHPDAWAYLQDDKGVGYYLLDCQSLEDDRKGYLIGSDSSCDIVIDDERIQPRHCLIYVENYTGIDNKCTIRVFLKDISETTWPTITSVNKNVIQKQSKEPVWLQNLDHIRFISPRENKPKSLPYVIYLRPNIIAKTFLDEFKLGQLIGRGNFASVYIATMKKRDPTQPEYYVVKIINKDSFKHQTKSLESFEQEISVLMLLQKHPGVVGIVKVFDSAKEYHIVMEYISEGDLFSHITNCGSLTESSTKIIFKQLFHTTKYLHDSGVVHRDIKPENIMMVNKIDMQVKICDFGLASLQQDNLMTRCGTEYYVAPEVLDLKQKSKLFDQITSKDPSTTAYGKECDLWSLGVVLYVCLCGTVPFHDEQGTFGSFSTRQSILTGRYNFNAPVWRDISSKVKSLIEGLLTVDVKKRTTVDEALNHPWFTQEE
ncbi:kinase-like domain-containing protein [Mucor mucedo]|uniref:kinase-like domain-containing protein n=1 Tax=Mucor mucedo TaxID=29922 RepID=UPI00221F05F8|nr:kinase-like domain-containing protein [Mucor mucedo]KAI7888326.1 kinase-like domain-containing protein [Mucor mucedo]